MRVTVRRRYRTGPTLPPTAAAEKRKVLPFCPGGGAPEAAGCPAPFRGGAGRDSPSAAGRGAAAPRRPSHPFPEKVFQRGWPPAGGACLHSAPTRQRQGRAARGQRAPPPARPSAGPAPPGRPRSGGLAGGGGERRGRPPAEHPPLPLGLPPRPPRPRTARSPVVALPALLAQQQVPKPVPRGQRGHLAVQLRHPARKRRTPAAAPLRRGNRPPTHQNRGGGGGSPARQEGPGAGSGAEGSGSSPRRVRGPRAQRRPARGGRAISRRWRGMAAPARAPGREWRLTDRGLKVPPRAAGRPGRPALGGGRRR